MDISFSLEKMASFSGQSGIEMVFFNPAPPLLEESEGNGKVKMTQVRLNYYNLSNEGMRFSLLISVPKKTFFFFFLSPWKVVIRKYVFVMPLLLP